MGGARGGRFFSRGLVASYRAGCPVDYIVQAFDLVLVRFQRPVRVHDNTLSLHKCPVGVGLAAGFYAHGSLVLHS